MFCKKCGYELEDDAIYCSNCGEAIEGRQVVEDKPAMVWKV
ncbi:MAG: zinc-ribbon domain-containing protein, partial [Bacilli bacterium]|nr:zinc-ribbon domain-containing protein [Bacilli bacterium]